MVMNEDYCDYKLSLALKACGFDEPCDHYYCAFDNETDVRFWSIHPAQSHNGFTNPDGKVIASAPTLAHAQKWLREKYGIHIDVCPYSDYSTDADGKVCDRWDFWGFDLYAVVGGKKMIDDDGEYDSYECALSAGIAAALELIKKGE